MLPRQILRHALFAFALAATAPAYAADPVFPIASRIGLGRPPALRRAPDLPGFENPQASALIRSPSSPPTPIRMSRKASTTTRR